MTDNKFKALSHERYSCRSYSSEVPGHEAVDAVLKLAALAPSACNRQPWRMMLIGPEDAGARQGVKASYNRPWIETAPYYVIVCGVASEAWVRPFDGKCHVDVDVSILTEHICLAATGAGMATCWVCNFDPSVLKSHIAFPDGVEPVAILPLGFAADNAVPEKKRREFPELIIRP